MEKHRGEGLQGSKVMMSGSNDPIGLRLEVGNFAVSAAGLFRSVIIE